MARTGMTAILEEVRNSCEAGTSEYTLGTTVYWSDNALQDLLDLHRTDHVYQMLVPYPTVGAGGTLSYKEYRFPVGYLEATTGGTTVLYLQDGAGATLGTALWSADYRRGVFSFTSDTLGSTLYLNAHAYDLNSTAADVWRRKAAHYAPTSFNFSTDNHSVSREQVYTHCIEMADFFEGMSGNAIQTIGRYRSDLCDGYANGSDID
jgi:hypothetical protein